MAIFGNSNPFLSESKFSSTLDPHVIQEEYMTVQGAVNKTLTLTAMLSVTAAVSFLYPNPIFLIVGIVGGLVAVLFSSFKPTSSPVAAPAYAMFEGLALGTISAMYAAQFPGIILNAITSTIGILFAMLMIYRSGIIKVTDKFRAGVMMATFGIFITYMVSWVLSMFNIQVPMIHQAGTFGIIFSIGVIVIATMNLLLDFDMIERGANSGAPKYMEWYSALGLLVTLVWLYLEILRLLSKLSSRR